MARLRRPAPPPTCGRCPPLKTGLICKERPDTSILALLTTHLQIGMILLCDRLRRCPFLMRPVQWTRYWTRWPDIATKCSLSMMDRLTVQPNCFAEDRTFESLLMTTTEVTELRCKRHFAMPLNTGLTSWSPSTAMGSTNRNGSHSLRRPAAVAISFPGAGTSRRFQAIPSHPPSDAGSTAESRPN